MQSLVLKPIARLRGDFPTKFGIPRQSGIADTLRGTIVFEPAYRDPLALRGLEGCSHLWLLWGFSENARAGWSPTVRPPRLGGNRRVGVFATRSPFRPNPIGLSSVRLLEILPHSAEGPLLVVAGADLMDGTPLYDIKPYLPYTDAHPDAFCPLAAGPPEARLRVELPEALAARVPEEKREALRSILAQDPRPAYQNDPDRAYGMAFAGLEIRFTVREGTLTVREILPGRERGRQSPGEAEASN